MIHLGFSEGGTVLSGLKDSSLHHTEFTMLSMMPVSYLCQSTSSPPISQSWKATFVLETVWKGMEKYLVLLRKKKWHLVLVINLDFFFIELTLIICFYEQCLAEGIHFLCESSWTFKNQDWFICFCLRLTKLRMEKSY